jgi:hypothetical protein
VRARSRRRLPWSRLIVVVLACVLLALLGLATNVLGVADKAGDVARKVELIINPPPDRPIDEEVLVTPRPLATATSRPAPTASLAPGETAPPAPTQTPVPERVRVDVNLYDDPAKHWITELDHEWCAVAGTQIVLAAHGKAPLTNAFQRQLAGRIGEWESRRDSRNGGWGPAAMVEALKAYGVQGYEVRLYETRVDAVREAAVAIEQLHAPVLLMAWRGAHTWVMTGFRADADPLVFDDAKITGAYVLDPWYPRVSSIWGPSDKPGTFQDWAEMRRNYLPWQRPEGSYPNRDGKFIAIVPTLPLGP